jgi:hypothetical protein
MDCFNCIDALGHVGYLLITAGMLAIGHNKMSGWLLRLAGESIWLAIGFMTELSSIWFWGIIFILIDIKMFMLWRKKKLIAKNCDTCS